MTEKTHEFTRNVTGLAPLDRVLGGGLVVGSVVLLASAPGVGKTTLTLQMLDGLGQRCLYVTGEETREHVGDTARRVGAVSKKLYMLAERNLNKILVQAREIRAQTIAIDSIQTMVCDDVSGKAGSLGQLRACTARFIEHAKKTDTTMWLIGHVTGAGDIAGPRTIEHDVDAVLKLEQGSRLKVNERILRCEGKNRFGSASVVGRFELTAKGFVPLINGGNGKLS